MLVMLVVAGQRLMGHTDIPSFLVILEFHRYKTVGLQDGELASSERNAGGGLRWAVTFFSENVERWAQTYPLCR